MSYSKSSYKKYKRREKQKEYTRKAVPIFTDEEREEMHKNNESFEIAVLRKFEMFKMQPEDIVDEARRYFRRRYQDHKEAGVKRKSSWLNSASSALTRLKAHLRKTRLAPATFTRRMNLTKRELMMLEKFNHRRLEQNATNLPNVDATALMTKLYQMLRSQDPAQVAIAISGMTGRRQSEVTHSAKFGPPLYPERHRYPSFWSHVTGFLKQKKYDRYAVRARELPMLAPRTQIEAAVNWLRDHWPSDDHQQAAKLYAKPISRAMKKHLAPLGVTKMHNLRKTFAAMAHPLFNEGGLALTAFASHVLGHKAVVSKRIQTYLSTNLTNRFDLTWLLRYSGSGLDPSQPEEKLDFGESRIVTPVNTSSEEEEEEEEEEEGTPLMFPQQMPKHIRAQRGGMVSGEQKSKEGRQEKKKKKRKKNTTKRKGQNNNLNEMMQLFEHL